MERNDPSIPKVTNCTNFAEQILTKAFWKGRFRGVGGPWAAAYRDRFWHKANFEGIEGIKAALEKEEKHVFIKFI